MVSPNTDTTERAEHDAGSAHAMIDRGSVAEQLAAVEPIVRRVCRSRLGPADGDDAAQQTLVKLWRRLEAGPPIESLPTYAAVYARYEALASVRGFAARPTVAVGDLAEWAWADSTPGPEAQALRVADVAEAAARVEELLGQLTPAQAHVLRATKLAAAEPDTETAARELGITASSVRTAQTRAMARLRELCGTRSPNPLASAVPEAARRQAAWAERAATRVAERMAHPSPAQAEFAAEFLQRRVDAGLSQSQLSAALGCDGSYVSKVERGKTWPSRDFARRVDEVLTTGAAFQDRHCQHDTETGTGREAFAEHRDLAADHGEFGDVAVADHDPDVSLAETACAVAHAAVQAAVGHAQAEDTGAGHATGYHASNHDEQARAAQFARWHVDDQDTAATDATADTDTDGEWAWSA